jgi:hypothetical protein
VQAAPEPHGRAGGQAAVRRRGGRTCWLGLKGAQGRRVLRHHQRLARLQRSYPRPRGEWRASLRGRSATARLDVHGPGGPPLAPRQDTKVGVRLRACASCPARRRPARQNERLLHPGTDTDTILGYYITAIRCLRWLDPQGSILHEVAAPVRAYVRARPDTIRLIVDNLVREEDSLIDADEPVVPLQAAQVQDYSDENWVPEPKDAAPGACAACAPRNWALTRSTDFRSAKPLDIVSTLVSIYDSRDLFIKELQVMLAKRLQEAKDGNFDNEVCWPHSHACIR